VTDLSGYRNSFFFQDTTGGISVDRTDNADVLVGDEVEITGTSGPGLFAPIIMASYVKVVGHRPPPPALRVNYGDLFGGAQDSQWVEMEGIVHSTRIAVEDGHIVLYLRLEIGGGPVQVLIHDFRGIDIQRIVDSRIRVRGVAATEFNQKRQFGGLDLYVPSQQFLEVLEPSNPDPFAIPTAPVAGVLQFGQAQHRVKIAGISTYQVTGHSIYLQDGADGIQVQSLSAPWIGPGRRIEAVGFPVLGGYAPMLEDAYVRDLGPAPPVKPVPIVASNVITLAGDFYQTPYDQQLVQLTGAVEESHIEDGQRVWLLQDTGQVFEAHLLRPANGQMPDLAPGTVLRLTGICVVRAGPDHSPVSFSILLRDPADVSILKRASWWTLTHSLFILAILAGLMMLGALWVMILRKRVEQQTGIIRASEERLRDLAYHDFLTGLPNRLALEDRIGKCLDRCRNDRLGAVYFTVDVDRFKRINDTYGHEVGDECLKIVATRLRSIVRKIDLIARTGGEEFAIVAGELSTPESAYRISDSISGLFQEDVVIQGQSIRLTVSVGGALYPDDGIDAATLRKMSDRALYAAKRTGRNRTIFASSELNLAMDAESAIDQEPDDSSRAVRLWQNS
jgi:diguanylate cyclase (GGDEF)-like protein